jgi:hypothetical protein
MGIREAHLVAADLRDKPDAVRFKDETEQSVVAVEARGAPPFHYLKPWLVMTVEQLVRDFARRGLVGELESFGAEPMNTNDRHQGVGEDASDGGAEPKVFELTLGRRARGLLIGRPAPSTSPLLRRPWCLGGANTRQSRART